MRKDAERNREKLIEAARDIMRNEGGDAPMELIADRAQLTRGTLYRNFPHRQAMYEAVLQSDLETVASQMSADTEDDPLAFIRHMTKLMMVYDKFLIALAAMPDYDADKNEERMVSIIAKPLANAQHKNVLRREFSGSDILTICRMLASNWRLDQKSDLASTLDERLALMMKGLAPAE